ncbi:uncharacterized protein TNCT_337681 [Trichonephila clavata]|uniref:Uncharacterized protein n=1 Tax=Trichonephila clavata TaxID=2740835 RepID=A0A8X6KD82_TRICU|nr:uncharacterized protein TNCT_337681 [Trichonephila clavata]
MMLRFFVLACIAVFSLPGTKAQLFTDRPTLIDQLLQTVWDPAALIHMWTALDQFYNIALGWRRAARTVASLPFGEGRTMDHVRIKEPRRSKMLHKLDMPHWERFNQVYSSSQPATASSNYLPVPNHYFLPPPLLIPQKGIFPHQQHIFNTPAGWVQNNYATMANRDDEARKYLKHLLQAKVFMDRVVQTGMKPIKEPGQTGTGSAPIPMMFFNSNNVPISNPETKLRMFLKLMKELGEMHTKGLVKFDDSKEESVFNR